MSQLSQRLPMVGDIEYIYIPKEKFGNVSVLLPPRDFETWELDLIRRYPANLVQLNDPFVYFGNVKTVHGFTPLRFAVVYKNSVDQYTKLDPFKTYLKVFLLSSEMEGLDEVIQTLKNTYRLLFLIQVNKPDTSFSKYPKISITSPEDFLSKLEGRRKEIEELLLEQFPKFQVPFVIDLPKTKHHEACNPFNEFRGSHVNYFTLNQILGNAWRNASVKEPSAKQMAKNSAKIRSNKDDTSRFDVLISQMEKMDELEIIVTEDREIKFPNDSYDWISPLLLIVPFHYPSIQEILDSSTSTDALKLYRKTLSSEKSVNYINYPAEGVTPEEIKGILYVQDRKISYLDGMGYLHASFTKSPVIKTRMLGSSIRKELSFFKPEAVSKIKEVKKLIDAFGEKLKDLILPNGLNEKLFGLRRQIVAITDLPIEWMLYKGQSLSLTYDITRIPELPYGGLMALYTMNSNVQYTVPKNIMDKTLVLLGVSPEDDKDEDFKNYFSQIEAVSQKLKFKTHRCQSIAEVTEQVNLHQPEFLIFDCHGDFDNESLSSYLLINNERLTGADIIKNKIVAPLIFLSACHTNPNYGYLNKLADAFFEAGCLSITATYFPISISRGSNLYYRLLNNLSNAANLGVHKNWLEFVCHTIRTSYYKDILYDTIDNIKSSTLEKTERDSLVTKLYELNLDIGLHMLRFDSCLDSLQRFKDTIEKACPQKLIADKAVPEYCFYTNMGRGDLVRFESWNQTFYQLNNLDTSEVKS